MKVNVGRGIDREVETDKLNAEVMTHVVYIGLRNILMDAHAGAAKAAGDGADDAKVKAVAESMVDKKLDALYRGEIRVAGERTSDPVLRLARQLATDYAARRPEWKALSKADFKAKVEALLSLPNSRFMRIAAESVNDAEPIDV